MDPTIFHEADATKLAGVLISRGTAFRVKPTSSGWIFSYEGPSAEVLLRGGRTQ